MKIGYACLALGVPGGQIKSCTRKNATEGRLLSLIEHNLQALQRILAYNIKNGIKLFRISSDLIPFGSSLAQELPWPTIYRDRLHAIGSQIRSAGIRVSMHPGQYTVLNSPDRSVADRAKEDLAYHAQVLTLLQLGPEHKIVLHLGGVYGDKRQAVNRFYGRYTELEWVIKERLVLENDDRLFGIGDVLGVALAAGIPVVYDNLHNAVNPSDESLGDLDWIKRCAETWTRDDGPQKIHYAQQHPHKKPGAHSDTIEIATFLPFYEDVARGDLDIMLEVKDKNVSALKCLNCISNRGLKSLGLDWERHKYSVLERSPENYDAICELLAVQGSYPALEMYRRVEASLNMPVKAETALLAATHVWKCLRDRVSESEERRFQRALHKLATGQGDLRLVKNTLLTLARKYGHEQLLSAYYLYL